MAISTSKPRTAIIVILAALLIGSLSSAAWTFQDPKRPPATEEERRRGLERLTKQLQEAQQSPRPAAGPFGQPIQPPAGASGTQASQPVQPTAPPAPVPSAAATSSAQKVQFYFENEDLSNFINQITNTLGLTPLVIDPDVKGIVNLSSGPVAKEDILPLFNLILKNNNAALIRQADVYQIVPISSALKKGVEVIEQLPEPPGAKQDTEQTPAKTPPIPTPIPGVDQQSLISTFQKLAAQNAPKSKAATPSTGTAGAVKEADNPKTSRLTTNIVRVEFIPVKDLIEPVKLFMTEGGVIMPYERLNMLILTDYSDNVARILQIIHMLDNSYLDPDLVELVKINNNASADVVDDLKKMFGSGTKDSTTGVSFVSLDRLNVIFVMASSKRALEEVKKWIKELDSSSAKNIQTYVYVVENSTASNIAMMLSALYGGEGSSTGGTAAGGTGTGGNSASRQGSQGTGTGTGGNTGSAGGGSTPFSGQSSYQSAGQYNSSYGNSGFGSGTFGSGYGSGSGGYGSSSFGAGRQLGPQLNTARTVSSQVLRGGQLTGLQDTVRMVVDDINNSLYIQATPADYAYISETIRKMDVMPRQALIDARIFEVDLTDNLNFGINATLAAKGTDSLTTGELSAGGLLSAQTFIPIGNAREIMAALQALRVKTKVKILEAPSVLALDGQQAQIMVGSEIPYPGTSFTPSVGGSTTSVQYRDTGISLIVVPRISASGSVTMDLVQEVSAPGANVTVGDGTATSFSKTSVSTTLTVKDGETVAIAGLIRDGSDSARSGIPFLSQIPLLGSLFGQTNRNSHRNELIILITPHVIRTPEKLQEMTQELKDSLRNVRQFSKDKDNELARDMEDARDDRYRQEQKDAKKLKASKPENPEKMEKSK
jgi:general secretion pathway protein D